MFNLPSGYKFTLANNTSDDLDSDADPNSGVTQSIIISATDKVINGGCRHVPTFYHRRFCME
ncbi:MAG: hypothetical protein U0T36_08270 [Saprospiraceae bacterium]